MSRLHSKGLFRDGFRKSIKPSRVIVLSFLTLILLGSVLLALPVSSRSGQATDYLTALFTATSATCVTGLIVVDTYTYWSAFGQSVILVLIQCGGLGFMTLATIFSFLLRRTITLRERLVMTRALNIDELSGVVRITRHILLGTLIAELTGAIILSLRFVGEFGWWGGIAKGVFHSVSAFCNAGFDLMGQKQEFSNMMSYVSDPIVNFTLMVLIITGGLGFIVWEDILHRRSFKRLSLQTKLAMVTRPLLLVSGAVLFFLFEYNNRETMGELNFGSKLMAAMFQSTTTRTAGFNTISQAGLTQASKLLSVILMFIGGSPGSTAGGIKTVNFIIIILAAASVMRGKSDITAFGRRVSSKAVLNAFSLAFVAL